MRVEYSGRRFDPIPIGAQSDELERIGDQFFKGGLQLEAERGDLRRSKTDPQPGRATRLNGGGPPGARPWLTRATDAHLHGEREGQQAADRRGKPDAA